MAAFVALLPAALVGCGSSAPSASQSGWASKAELTWMGEFGRWQRRVDVALAKFQAQRFAVYHSFGTADMPALRGAAAAVSTQCVHVDVPAAPTPRLESVIRAGRAGCARYASVAHAVLTTRTAVVYGVLSNSLVEVLRQGAHRFQTAAEKGLLGAGPLTFDSSAPSPLQSHIDRSLGRIASLLAGHTVRVRCWSARDWQHLDSEYAALGGRPAMSRDGGWTPVSGSRIDLKGDACARLERLEEDPRSVNARNGITADAVRLLAHESQHAAGVADEAIAECYALQTVREAARDLGVGNRDAAGLARIAWADYPDELSRYHTSKCHNDGPLDLRPDDPVWP